MDVAANRYLKPFPHAVIEGFFPPELVARINQEWPQDWHKEEGRFNKKWSSQNLVPSALEAAGMVSVGMVEDAVGISGLFADPDRFGAGLHCIPRGGFLKMHVDFNQHPNGWHRRANVLIYLNERWEDSWGGQLQLGLGKRAVKIAPLGGRCVIFETNDETWHGHPEPLNCPDDVQRRSLALYFYTKEAPRKKAHTTIYRK